uniref:Coiled-coil domain-containing protein n=1 Tax=Elaeophora elaphi TaxID=1147741 RepID=A0A158Q8H2_9BILA
MAAETMNARSEKPNCSDIVREVQLDVAEELGKQQLEVERVDAVLSLLKELESDELEVVGAEFDPLLVEPHKFQCIRDVLEDLNQYTALVQRALNLTRQYGSNFSKQEYVTDNSVEKIRDGCDVHSRLSFHNTATFTVPSQNLSDLRISRLTIIPTTTVHVSPGLTDAVPKGSNDNLHIRPREVLIDARQTVRNQRVHSASEPGSLLQLTQSTVTANQKPHPFLSQAGYDSHSLHAAMQNVVGLLKRTLPGFHPIASTILNSDVFDFISAFANALRRYDDRVRSQIKLLLEKYDSSVSSIKRSELVCEIDHLHKISRSASMKREELLDIIHGPYYQAANCPPLRQMKILYSTFSSNSS